MTTEADYLNRYDTSHFPSPLVTVDSMLFTLHQQALYVLLVEQANQPQEGRWELPDGFIDIEDDDSTHAIVLRELTKKTGASPSWLGQLDTFSGPDRDPRGQSLTVAWFALVVWVDCAPHIASISSARWVPVGELKNYSLAFDHEKIITAALRHLRQKTMYSFPPVYCLPETFTHRQLLGATEVILGQSTQRKGLIRRFEAPGMFEDTEEGVTTGAYKARLWRHKPNIDFRLFSRNLLTDQQ